nr:hypothetical protein [Candidatus Sigynarchaeum springense]
MALEHIKLSEFVEFARNLEDKTRGGEMRTFWPGEYPLDLAMKPERAWLCLMLLDEIKGKTQDVNIPPGGAPGSDGEVTLDVSMDEALAVIERIAVLASQRDPSIASEGRYKGDWWRETDTPNEALRGYPAIRQDWESVPTAWPSWDEAGEYDGETLDEGDEVYSLHLDIADCKAFIKAANDRGLAIGKPKGAMQNVLLDKATYEKIKASKRGIIVGDEDANDERDADDGK